MTEAAEPGPRPLWQLTREQRNTAILLAVLGVICFVVEAFKEPLLPILQYDRVAILNGEVWRVLTDNLVHASFIHTVWNVVGLALAFAILLDAASPRDFIVLMLVSSVAIGIGLLAFAPGIGFYIGFSGTTHGLYAGGALLLTVRGRPWFGLLVLAVILVKIGYEQLYGPVPLSSGALGDAIATEAHASGVVGGLIAGAGLALLRLRGRRASSPG